MAYVYPEDRIVSGEVIDPRPINRLLGRYYAEFNGMLDRDNFYQEAFTAAKMRPFTSSSGGAPTCTAPAVNTPGTHNYLGPFNAMKAVHSIDTMTIDEVERSIGYQTIDDMTIQINTLDSIMCIDFWVSFEWDDFITKVALTQPVGGYVSFCITVDGISVDETGEIYTPSTTNGCAYMCPSVPIGSGSHTITAKVSRFFTQPLVWFPVLEVGYLRIRNRALIVREVRR